MSRRRLLGSGAAALALVLALPTAAFACEKGDGGRSGGGSQSRQDKSEHAKSDSDHGKSDDSAKSAHGKSDDSAKSAHGKKDDSANSDQGKSDDSAKSQGGSSDSASGHNPPGNNGTIKIDYAAPADSGHANRPHPGCAFQLRMFNFDTNQYGTITFVGQAPTKLGTLLTQTHVLLSNDAAGGGQDVDEVYGYTAQQLGLIGKPQAKQGWHIKVSVDAENAPGGAKHKVFWLKCDTPKTTETNNSSTTTQSGSTTTPVDTSTTTSNASSTTAVTGTTAGAATAAAPAAAAPAAGAPVAAAPAPAAAAATTMTGGEAAAAAAAPAAPAAPAAQPASRGSALPFTGTNVITMLLVALAALVAGGLAVRAGRRRTARV